SSSRRMTASARPRSTVTLPNSTRLTMPLTTSPTRSLYSLNWRARPASRTFLTITCLAVFAAWGPNSICGEISARKNPDLPILFDFLRGSQGNLGKFIFNEFGHLQIAHQLDFAGLAVDRCANVMFLAVFGAAGLLNRLFHGDQHLVAFDAFFAGDCV